MRIIMMINCLKSLTLRKTFPYLELFWSKCGKCGKNVDQNNSEYGHFLRSVKSICNALIAPKITLARYIESDDDIRSINSEQSF